MDSVEQEEVVKLIFGEEAPDGWRDNKEFILYLTELGTLGADRLTIEPERVKDELSTVQMQTQELAFSNYKTFIQTSDCSKQIYSEFGNTENHLENLVEKMPGFLEKCEIFKSKASEISTHRRLTSLTLSKHTTLLEILELPQLMDTVVRNQHYDEALELHAYVTKLAKKQPEVKILADISRNVSNSVKLMLQQLLAQLRSPIQLPQCLKVISYLRRMDIFTESELRLKFLQARETWLQSVTNTVARDDPYLHITRTMEVMRVHLFDIVTQYRAIFSDDAFFVEADNSMCDNRLLFSSWLSRKIEEFLCTLEMDLEQDIGSMESLMGQAMYFGLSFSRVGFDFRPLLAPIFEKRILAQFNKLICWDNNVKVVQESFVGFNLVKASGLQFSFQPQAEATQPPLILLEFPPLAHACNIILSAFNAIRLCAPLSICGSVTSSLQNFLAETVNLLLAYHRSNSAKWRDTEKLGFKNLCLVFKSVLLPYIQQCLSALFPPNYLSEICGFSSSDLQSRKLGFIIQAKICLPILDFMPEEPDELIIPPPPASGTEYVADRMEELALAVQGVTENGNSKEDVYHNGDVSDGSAVADKEALGENDTGEVTTEVEVTEKDVSGDSVGPVNPLEPVVNEEPIDPVGQIDPGEPINPLEFFQS
ncbi:conserved oligomeric Golgi complex subunit 8 isoform X2 [Eurytemora carolleeae]|uniref:conserved oligomeric Golgi complex subunit 8 isoform X2 n=1 Tax=Eurytemora carolleeae TaxID=1294199 RepID=UPI000C7695AB|nr:conserved oligomeric Golgi complex subunit 8 isoform X2 [Eurytemora carolleeae]|eukprot:XP_023331474.1 conserved oligomeric Golgi complex subunit 8-like isoform X2 [Eurytemora affinis]